MTYVSHKPGIRYDLVVLWRKNVRGILDILGCSQGELAKACGICRSSITLLLTNREHRLTGIQFLGTMHALDRIIETSVDASWQARSLARDLWNQVNNEWKGSGLACKTQPMMEDQ